MFLSKLRKRDEFFESIDKDLWWRLYSRLIVYWKFIVIGTLFSMLASFTQPALAYMMKLLLDEGFIAAKHYYIWAMPVAIITLMLIRTVCTFVAGYSLAYVANKALFGIRADMFKSLLLMPDSEFLKGDTGRLINRFTVDAGNVTDYAAEAATIIIRETFVIISLVAMLIYFSWQLSLVVLVIFPVSVVVGRYFVRRLRMINRKTIDTNAELTTVIRESILGQRIIKLFGGYDRETRRFDKINHDLKGYGMREAVASSLMSPLTQWIISFSVGAVISMALYQAQSGEMTLGDFMGFLTALGQIFDPVKRLTNLTHRIQKMMTAAESVFKLIDAPKETQRGMNLLEMSSSSHIKFNGVSFQFPDTERPVLSDINLDIHSGQTVAFVGRSGAGKSTLVNLIPRFLDPTQGGISIDGTDIRDYELQSLRSQISFVSQQVFLFEGTLADNVRYGAYKDITEENLIDALKAANLWTHVESLPDGMNTMIGEDGTWLSGGQRQRLAIARALVKNAPILILDEATSALDNESEKMVQEALEVLMKGRTTFVIAHRLSTVQNADRIIVLDNGSILEDGNHEQLLKKEGLYQSLYSLQFAEN